MSRQFWQGLRYLSLAIVMVCVAESASEVSAAPQHGGGSVEPAFAGEARLIIQQTMKELRVPGVIIGVWRGPEAWVEAFGVGNLATGEPMRRGDHVRIASITKSFTGTILLQLVDEGKIALDDPVSKYIPGIPNGDKITIRMLGDMTSGLFTFDADQDFVRAIEANPYQHFGLEETVQIGLRNPPYFAPGAGWHYSNTNTNLLGMLIQQLTGQSLAEVYQERLFTPLGMRHTYLSSDGSLALPHARGYSYGTFFTPKVVEPDAPLQDVTHYNPSYAWSAGGLVSTIDDMCPFARALATGQLTSASAHAERLKWQGALGGQPYGFAIENFIGLLGHAGQVAGYQSIMGHDPDRDLTLIILTNLDTAADGSLPTIPIFLRVLSVVWPE
jgi:D-alanyl-D-alanine carboxypeptidase